MTLVAQLETVVTLRFHKTTQTKQPVAQRVLRISQPNSAFIAAKQDSLEQNHTNGVYADPLAIVHSALADL